jgi:hypothetical protein
VNQFDTYYEPIHVQSGRLECSNRTTSRSPLGMGHLGVEEIQEGKIAKVLVMDGARE